jgi:hypothetical protein
MATSFFWLNRYAGMMMLHNRPGYKEADLRLALGLENVVPWWPAEQGRT